MITKKTIAYGCPQHGIKQKSVTFVANDLEIWWRHILEWTEISNTL